MRSSLIIALSALLWGGAAAAQEPFQSPSVHLMGFGDVVYVATGRDAPEGFLLGQAVGHLNAVLSDRLLFFGEVSATARPTGFAIEAERLVLRYDFADYFKLSVGRYHTPIGYWNTAFHHGMWLQTSVARPEMVKFGSRLLPVHFVGLMAEGHLPASSLGLGYAAGVGNGRFSNIARAGDAGDINGQRAAMLSLYARPAALYGLQIGGNLYLDRASPEEGPAVDERILSAHLVLERERPEIVAEYARLFHAPVEVAGEEAVSDAYYLQLAYRLSGAARAWKPYLRAERVLVSEDDLLLAPLGLDYEAAIAGVRYDFAPLAALKAEYRWEEYQEPERVHSLYLQASFAIPGSGIGGAAH